SLVASLRPPRHRPDNQTPLLGGAARPGGVNHQCSQRGEKRRIVLRRSCSLGYRGALSLGRASRSAVYYCGWHCTPRCSCAIMLLCKKFAGIFGVAGGEKTRTLHKNREVCGTPIGSAHQLV